MEMIADRIGLFLSRTSRRYHERVGYVRGTQKWLLKRGARLAGVEIHFPLDDPEFRATRAGMGVANWALNGLRATESLKQLIKVVHVPKGKPTLCALDAPAIS
jgi:hypothetical protein